MKTKRVVRAALKGILKNKAYVIPGFMNRMMDIMGRKLMARGMSAGMWGMLMQRVAPANLKF